MKAKLIVQTNEVVIRDYSLIEDEGISSLVSGSKGMGNPDITMQYEDDEESPGQHMIVISALSLEGVFKFLEFAEIPVFILT